MARSDEEDEDSTFNSDDLDNNDDVPPTKRRAMGGSVLAHFGLNINQQEYHDYDDDNLSDMEAGYGEVERENERAYVFFVSLSRSRLPECCVILTIISGCSLREAKREDRIALEE